jgi:hypothetical protein
MWQHGSLDTQNGFEPDAAFREGMAHLVLFLRFTTEFNAGLAPLEVLGGTFAREGRDVSNFDSCLGNGVSEPGGVLKQFLSISDERNSEALRVPNEPLCGFD